MFCFFFDFVAKHFDTFYLNLVLRNFFAQYLNKSIRDTIQLICRVNSESGLVGAVALLYLTKKKEILTKQVTDFDQAVALFDQLFV